MIKEQPLLTPLMLWFMLAMILANIAGQMYPLMLPIYLTKLGASVGQVGLVFTLSSVVILVLQIVGGWISDSIGRLRAIAIGGVGGMIGFTAMLLAPTWQWMLVANSIIQIPYALVGPSFGAFIAENSSEENRGKVYGLVDTLFQITGIVGPALGGFLVGAYNFKAMLLIAGIFYTAATLLRIWMATTMHSLQERKPTTLSLVSFKTSMGSMVALLFAGGVITWILITDGVRDIAFRMSSDLQPLYLSKVAGISVEQIGLLGSINAIAMMSIPVLSGKLSDRYGERLPLASGFLLIFGAFMIFLQARSFPIFALSWITFGLGGGLLGPAFQSLISKVVPQHLLGTFLGVFFSSLGFVSLPAPWIGAQLWERFNPQLPFVISAIAALVMIPLIWLRFRVPSREARQGAAPAVPDEAPVVGEDTGTALASASELKGPD